MILLEASKKFLSLLAKAEATATPKKYSVSATPSAQKGLESIYLSGKYKKAEIETRFESCFRNFYQGTFAENPKDHKLNDAAELKNARSCHPFGDEVVVINVIDIGAMKGKPEQHLVNILYIGNHSNNPYYDM